LHRDLICQAGPSLPAASFFGGLCARPGPMKSKVQRKNFAAKTRKRNPARTRETILQAAVAEFCRNGFTGARVETISARSGANMRLLYHYFGDKDGLYMAALDRVYTQVRAAERRLDLGKVEPVEGMSRLIDFTFEFFAAHPEYVSLLNN